MPVERLARNLGKCLIPVARFMNRLSYSVIFLMMLLTVADVISRKLWSTSILGTVELTELMMIMIVFLGLAHCQAEEGHIKVDLVVGRFGPRVQAVIDIFTQALCAVLFTLVTRSCLIYAETMREAQEVTQDLWIPIWPFVYVVAAGCGVLALILYLKLVEAAGKAVGRG